MTRRGATRESGGPPVERIRLDGIRKQALETGRNRLLATGVVFGLAFLAIAGRLIDVTVGGGGETRYARAGAQAEAVVTRADIVDRNGIVLATSLPTASLFADPRDVPDAGAVAARLAAVLPGLGRAEIIMKLKSPGRFVWLRRNLTPRQLYEVNRLGIPGLAFRKDERRVYPHGRAAAHILGLTDVDGRGIAGVERYFEQTLTSGGGKALRLSIDLRIQTLLRRELAEAVGRFRAIGAAGVIVDAATGEVLAMVSLPDFDPNTATRARGEAGFNRATKGVYEMGSTFKLFTAAMALDSGTVDLEDGYDASKPLHVARFTIADYHGKNRWLSVPEIVVYSSNIGAAKMAVDVGTKRQRAYLERLGLLRPAEIELPEVGAPLAPSPWREINTMTISYGHGIAVSPLQVASAVATVVNGGVRQSPTLLTRPADVARAGPRVFSEKTSGQMRRLMRLVVSRGTGRNADTPGYKVGGKTGTAEKQAGGRYRAKALISSFVGAFPIDAPRYVVLVLIDEPKGNASTHNYATGGWVAAPVVGRVVRRMAPILGIAPDFGDAVPLSDRALLASVRKALADIQERRLAAR